MRALPRLVVLAALLAASVACGEADPLPPSKGGDGGGDGGSGGSGGGGAGGAGGGAGGSGGTIDPGNDCDDPTDECNGGICPFEDVDCATAAANFVTQCGDPACGLQEPGTGACQSAADAEARCLEGKRNRPSDNVLWECLARHAACGQDYTVCVLGTCNPE